MRLSVLHGAITASVLLPLLLLLLLLAWNVKYTIAAITDETVTEYIYNKVSDQQYTYACVRLLHKGGTIGCRTPMEGTRGALRLATDQVSLQNLLESSYSDAITIVASQSTFNPTVINQLKSQFPIAGVILVYSDVPQGGYSPASPRPQEQPIGTDVSNIRLDPNLYPYISNVAFNRSYEWNPLGDDMSYQSYEFGIIYIDDIAESDGIKKQAQENENRISDSTEPVYEAEFRYRMYAEESTVQCLDDRTCEPLGSLSLWASMGNVDTTKDFILAMTSIDGNAVFHDYTPSALSDQTSVVALLAAMEALSRARNVTGLEKQIVFAFFNGERWDHSGSRRFVTDLYNFVCQDYSTSSQNACNEPYKTDLTFKSLNLTRISSLLELQQIGVNNSIFMHREQNTEPSTTPLCDSLHSLATNTSLNLDYVNGTPGIPPSATQAFLSYNSSIPAVVLASFSTQFANNYYASHYDIGTNPLLFPSTEDTVTQICETATLTARYLYSQAGGRPNFTASITANCSFVATLFDCLTISGNCSLIQDIVGNKNYASIPAHYASVFQFLPTARISSKYLILFYSLLDKYTSWTMSSAAEDIQGDKIDLNSDEPSADQTSDLPALSALPKDVPFQSNAHWHDAFDPGFVFDYSENRWNILNSSDTNLWTESDWWKLSTRIYRKETNIVVFTMLGIALGLLCIEILAFILFRRYLKQKYKAV